MNSVTDLLVNQIQHDILFAIIPENLIFTTQFLKSQYGGSTLFLNEALLRLQSEGLVKLYSKNTYQVVRPHLSETTSNLKNRVSIESEGLAKSILNGNIHWHGMVLHAHKNWIDSCNLAIDEPRIYALDFEENIRLFHQKLISACGSLVLIAQQEKLFQQGRQLRLAAIQNPTVDLKSYTTLMQALMEDILSQEIQSCHASLEKLIHHL